MDRWLLRFSLAILTLFVLARAASAAQTGGGYYVGPPPTITPPQLAGGPPPSCSPLPCGYVDGGIVPGPGGGYVSANPPYVSGPPTAYVDPNPPYIDSYGQQGGSSYYREESGGQSQGYSGGDRYGPGPCDPCAQGASGGGAAWGQGYATGYRQGYRDGREDAVYGGGYSQQSYDRRWSGGCDSRCQPCQSTPRYNCRTGEVSLNDSFFYGGGGVEPPMLSYGGGGGGGYAAAGAGASASAYASSSVSIRYGGRGGGRPPKGRGGCGCK
jgi:hypothetical protein